MDNRKKITRLIEPFEEKDYKKKGFEIEGYHGPLLVMVKYEKLTGAN